MAKRIRLTVGRQRLGANVRPSEAAYTKSVRKQMDHIENTLKDIIAQIEDVTPEALEYAVQPIFDKSQVYVPVDTSELKNSGFIYAQKTSKGAHVTVAYGKGGKPHYAVFVHERLDLKHAAPTQAKFLERAADEHMDEVLPRAAEYLKKSTGIK